jgi:hypothetical protein
MNDVDKLRQAMGQPPATQFAEVDVDRIMRLGGRRIRQRLVMRWRLSSVSTETPQA